MIVIFFFIHFNIVFNLINDSVALNRTKMFSFAYFSNFSPLFATHLNVEIININKLRTICRSITKMIYNVERV